MIEHTSPMAPEYNQFPGWSPPTLSSSPPRPEPSRVRGNPMSKEDTEELLRAAAEQLKPPMPLKDLQRIYLEIVNQLANDLRAVGAGGDSRIPEDMAADLIALGWEKRE